MWIFGWDKLSPRLYLAAIWLTAIGTSLSAFFILSANSWMQHPVGYRVDPVALIFTAIVHGGRGPAPVRRSQLGHPARVVRRMRTQVASGPGCPGWRLRSGTRGWAGPAWQGDQHGRFW